MASCAHPACLPCSRQAVALFACDSVYALASTRITWRHGLQAEAARSAAPQLVVKMDVAGRHPHRMQSDPQQEDIQQGGVPPGPLQRAHRLDSHCRHLLQHGAHWHKGIDGNDVACGPASGGDWSSGLGPLLTQLADTELPAACPACRVSVIDTRLVEDICCVCHIHDDVPLAHLLRCICMLVR